MVSNKVGWPRGVKSCAPNDLVAKLWIIISIWGLPRGSPLSLFRRQCYMYMYTWKGHLICGLLTNYQRWLFDWPLVHVLARATVIVLERVKRWTCLKWMRGGGCLSSDFPVACVITVRRLGIWRPWNAPKRSWWWKPRPRTKYWWVAIPAAVCHPNWPFVLMVSDSLYDGSNVLRMHAFICMTASLPCTCFFICIQCTSQRMKFVGHTVWLVIVFRFSLSISYRNCRGVFWSATASVYFAQISSHK